MRTLTFEEREDLVRRSGEQDVLSFVEDVKSLSRKHRLTHQGLLSILLHAPKETDIAETFRLSIRNTLAETGMEFTPAELTETIETIFCKMRNALRDYGMPEDRIPDSDKVLLAMLKEMGL